MKLEIYNEIILIIKFIWNNAQTIESLTTVIALFFTGTALFETLKNSKEQEQRFNKQIQQ